jgi:hypothetical protein
MEENMSITEELLALKQELDDDINLKLQDNMFLCKKEVIDFVFKKFNISSVAELGCVWGVEGVYGRYIAEKYPQTKVMMVDTHWTKNAKELCGKYSNIRIISDNFGNPGMPVKIGKVDAIILFDVLLHQVAPDWDRIIQIYAPYTNFFLIVNHQYIASPVTIRLLDLGPENYFANAPHDREHPTYKSLFEKMYEIHPDHNRIWRDIHQVWQWGITDTDLLYKMHELNFNPVYLKNLGNCGGNLSNWEYNSFVFQKNVDR